MRVGGGEGLRRVESACGALHVPHSSLHVPPQLPACTPTAPWGKEVKPEGILCILCSCICYSCDAETMASVLLIAHSNPTLVPIGMVNTS